MDKLSTAIIGGVFVYVASQYFQKFILEPLVNYKKTTTEISHILLLNQAKITNCGPDENKLKEDLHLLSAKLRAFTKVIPFYDFFRMLRIFGLPQKKDILSASHRLNFIGYSVIGAGLPKQEAIIMSAKAVDELRELLNIETTYTAPIDSPNKKMNRTENTSAQN